MVDRGAPLATRSWGSGPRAVVLAHCSLAHGGAWSGVAADLDDLCAMTAVDLPSHGRSWRWAPGLGDYHDVATHALRRSVLTAGRGGPVDLVGHSLGGTLVLRLALETPELVRSLALVEPVLFAAVTGGGPVADNRAFAEAWGRGDREEASRAFMSRWGAGMAWEWLPDRMKRYIVDRIEVIPATSGALSEDSAGLLRPGRLEGLARPVTLIHGAASAPLAPEIVHRLAARLPDAEVVAIPGAGHMAPITHPAAVAEALRRLLARS
ncbi:MULTISPECIES: alpha/beta fold hydrolase [unclassified Haematobacter]|uniref:alpha/beta fold hydrolase n=1 Tax=unclassified Haematobacter TaxID=2640585 RepID=UPI0025B896D0|nr:MULTISPECIES: alpha/beta hydrolase [unclassified Haematobacter]